MYKFPHMARYSETIPTNGQAIRNFAADLRVMADDFERQAEFMDQLHLPEIDVTHWKSARDAVAGFSAFAGAIKKAIVDARMMGTVDAMLVKQPTVQESQAAVIAELESAKPSRKKASRKGKSK